MPDYSKGKIYTIRCRSNPEYIYVGSTIQSLSKRWGGHKTRSKTNGDRLLYSTIGNNWTDWYIELYVEYPCENKEHLLKKEGEIIRDVSTLNMKIAGRTEKEWKQDNIDKIKEQQKEYRQNNTEKIKELQKKYQEEHKEEKKEYNKEYMKEYRKTNLDKRKEYRKEYNQRKKLEKQNLQNTALIKKKIDTFL